MKLLIAPDSFKESLCSKKVGSAIAKGFKEGNPKVRVQTLEMADGGEGTLKVLASPTSFRKVTVKNALLKSSIVQYSWTEKKKTALIEMAQVCGLSTIPVSKRNPFKTTSYGLGQLIKKALDQKSKRIILTLGGVATHDLGVGMAQALGYQFLDIKNRPIAPGLNGLKNLNKVLSSPLLPALKKTEIIGLTDVSTPLLGKLGSSVLYAPQKGARLSEVDKIDQILSRVAKIIHRDLRTESLNVSHAGAAGGTGAGILAFLQGKLCSGIDFILEETQFEKKLKNVDLVITGEGKIDDQTCEGKVIAGICKLCKEKNVPVIALCGAREGSLKQLYRQGLLAAFCIHSKPLSLEQAFIQTETHLEQTAEQIAKVIKLFRLK